MASYDFIIIGGGTAGLVVASRLTENPNISVLVLETGEDMSNDPTVRIPAFYTALQGTAADWNFVSEPQPHLNGRRIPLNQGKALGGSSAINAQVFVPPSKTVIDAWEELGNAGWNWETLEPYFAKIHSVPMVSEMDKKAMGITSEGKSGQVQTSFPDPSTDPLPAAWMSTFEALGHKMIDDPFSGAASGAFIPLSSVDPVSSTRSYAVTAYAKQAQDRENLKILTGATVHKILLEGNPAHAIGVLYQRDSKMVTVKADKEVILAAGAFQSPKLLELSGIGDGKLLRSLDINVVVDNPNVGENLQDHVLSGIGYEAGVEVRTKDSLLRGDPGVLEAAMVEYTTKHSGPLALVGVSTFAFLPVVDWLSKSGEAELESLLQRNKPRENATALAKLYYGISSRILQDPNEASGMFLAVNAQAGTPTVPPSGSQPGNYITTGPVLSMPLSRGYVHIRSNDIDGAPVIDPKFMTHPVDLEVFARHLLYTQTIANTNPFKSALLKPHGRLRDPKSNLKTLEEAKEYAGTSGISMWHPVGTCSMLPEAQGGVVNPELIVYGTTNLRVVDASIFPLITRGNTQASVYAVAERAADIIKSGHGM